ncbi:Nucleotidyltransferase domain-containing protein [Flavobacterium micromati]|uniref:Nucleotidyltransferase domain-containing protein n=1 Tax=Flavobacterium micromati TaxID=229205 RepID=A0A1M5II70_9FLAO|nr:nucleotidyltransferase domain-containing protein [Flavobacterium micromati]SHG27957.1 Nucleotidyltransferase domain-containing protein [Flavobacterium micromati]
MFGLYDKSYKEILEIIANSLSIKEVVIYGSRAKGNYKEGSVIDITILGEPTPEDVSKLWHDLDDSFIPYKFDISVYNNLKSDSLKEHINKVGKTFYKLKEI